MWWHFCGGVPGAARQGAPVTESLREEEEEGFGDSFFPLMCPQCTEQCRAQNRGLGAGGGKNSFSSANPSPVARAKYRCWCLQNGQGEAWVLDTSFPTF